MRNSSNHVDSIIKWSQDAGKSTGIVTTTRVTHASPGGAYAHIANRDWEDDSAVAYYHQDPILCDDMAEQLVINSPGKDLKVILGGGRQHFRSKFHLDESKKLGKRSDGVDLIETWMDDKANRGVSYKYVWNKEQLKNVNLSGTDFLLGLFDYSHLPYRKLYTKEDETNVPTLEEMTRAAIERLSLDENGYFLFVEGGRIDHAHHSDKAHLALDETKQFSEAVNAAVELTNERDTLIIVTSDHSHSMTISGYPPRGNDIFGFAGFSSRDELPYTTLSYATGRGYFQERDHICEKNPSKTSFRFPATVPLSSAVHAGEDVAVFARGPWSYLFSGTYEQNYIPHAMAFASCVGPGRKACDNYCNLCP